MRMERSTRRPAWGWVLLTLLALLPLGACKSANPSNRRVVSTHPLESTDAPAANQASWPFGGSDAPPPVVQARPSPSGVTSDPGTRYLSMGSVGALTVETPPPPPPAKP